MFKSRRRFSDAVFVGRRMLSWVVKVVPQPPEPPSKKADEQKEEQPAAAPPPVAAPPPAQVNHASFCST